MGDVSINFEKQQKLLQQQQQQDERVKQLFNSVLKSTIDATSQAEFPPELVNKIDALEKFVESKVALNGDSIIAKFSREFLVRAKIKYDEILSELTMDPGTSQVSHKQFVVLGRIGRIVMNMIMAHSLYNNKSLLNKMDTLCGIGAELARLKSNNFDAMLEAYNNLNVSGDDEEVAYEMIQSTTTFKTMNISKRLYNNVMNTLKVNLNTTPVKFRVNEQGEIIPITDDTQQLSNTPKAFLLYGPPGTGKTTLAMAIASEFSEGRVYMLHCGNLLEEYLGASEKKLMTLFKHVAKTKERVTIILDEIDSIFSNEAYHKSLVQIIQLQLGSDQSLGGNMAIIGITNYMMKIPLPFQRRFKMLLIGTEDRNQLFLRFMDRLCLPYDYRDIPENIRVILITALKDFLMVNFNRVTTIADYNKYYYTEATLESAYKFAAEKEVMESPSNIITVVEGRFFQLINFPNQVLTKLPPFQYNVQANDTFTENVAKIVNIREESFIEGFRESKAITNEEAALFESGAAVPP